jgi:multicomponent Na+:H+ antiporter subunit B
VTSFNDYFVIIDLCLLVLVTSLGVAAVAVRNLLGATMLMSIYSLLMASVWTNMDSMDVAFTEAAVGAGVSTVLLIGALVQVGNQEKPSRWISPAALAATAATAIALIYGTTDMPRFGDPKSPANRNPVSIGYIRQDVQKENDYRDHYARQPHVPTAERPDYFHGHVPNMVTAVIVSYRGYDTMYETTVIFIAGVSMILFLRRRRTA